MGYRYPIELTNIKCKTHPDAELDTSDGGPEWYLAEPGKWILDMSNVFCPVHGDEQLLFTYTVAVNMFPEMHSRPMMADIDDSNFI